MPLPNPAMSFSPFAILTAAEMNDMVENDQALQDWTAFDDGTFPSKLIQGVSEGKFNYVASGGVIAGTGYGSTLGWSLSSGVVWINGKRYTIAATTGTVTASRDTYFDLLLPVSGTVATLVNTGGNIVTNGAAAPALAANSVRLGKVVSAANIAAASSILQAYKDSLGNMIYPRAIGSKVTDANNWIAYYRGDSIEYRKRITYSQALTTGVSTALTVNSNVLPVGMATLSTNLLVSTPISAGFGGDIKITPEMSSASTVLSFVARTTASTTFSGYIDNGIITP